MFQSSLGHVRFLLGRGRGPLVSPVWTGTGPRSRPDAIRSRWGRTLPAGRPRGPADQTRSARAPLPPAGTPPSPAFLGRTPRAPSLAGTQTPKGGPWRGLWDSRGLRGSRVPLPGGFSAPRGLRVGASHGAELGAPAAPACAGRRAAVPRPWAGRRWGGRKGGAREGGVGRWAVGSPPLVKRGRRWLQMPPTSPQIAGPRRCGRLEMRSAWGAQGCGEPVKRRLLVRQRSP